MCEQATVSIQVKSFDTGAWFGAHPVLSMEAPDMPTARISQYTSWVTPAWIAPLHGKAAAP